MLNRIVVYICILRLCFLKVIPDSGMGVNLRAFGPASTLPPFTDLFKLAQPFYPQRSTDDGKTWGYTHETLDRSANGYPSFLHNKTANSYDIAAVAEIGYSSGLARGKLYSAGRYILLYDGTGNVTVEGDGKTLETDLSRRRLAVEVTPGTSILIRIRRTESNDPITNIRFIPAEFEETYNTSNVFHPKFLELVRPFRTLRFCGWQQEFYNPWKPNPRSWLNRTRLEDPSQNNPNMGFALEYMLQLTRLLNSSAWFCLPANCDDDYIRNFAGLLRDGLNESHKLYIEYSSNVGLVPAMANQTNRIATIFTEVFNETRRAQQLVIVAPSVLSEYFPHTTTYFEGNYTNVDAIAIDGSFGRELGYDDNYLDLSRVESLTKQKVIEILKSSVLDTQRELNRFVQKVRVYNLSAITFTGGVWLRAPPYGHRSRLYTLQRAGNYVRNETLENLALKEREFAKLLLEVHRDPQVKEIYMDMLRRWFVMGGLLFVSNPLEGVPDLELEGYTTSIEDRRLPLEGLPKYGALVAHIAGNVSALPYTAADLPRAKGEVCEPACKWGTCFQSKCVCFAGYQGTACTELGSKPNKCTNGIGINLAGLCDWSTEWSFVDLFKLSRQWVTQEHTSYTWDTGRLNEVPMRPDGYPAQLPTNVHLAALMVRDLNAHYENGTYVCLYDGDGILSFGLTDVKAVRRSVGRVELTVIPATDFNNGTLL